MEENVENITLEGLAVGSVAQNLEAAPVIHDASLGDYTVSTKNSVDSISQLQYGKDEDTHVFLVSSDLVNSERSKNEINKNSGYVVIGKDNSNNDISVVLFSEDGYQTDEEIEHEKLLNYKNRLQNYFQFDWTDEYDEITSCKLEEAINDVNASINTINATIGADDEADGGLRKRIKTIETILENLEIPNVNALISAHNEAIDAHNNKFDSLRSELETSRVAVVEFESYKISNTQFILDEISDLVLYGYYGDTKFDGLESKRGSISKAIFNYLYFPDDFLPSNPFKKISIYTHPQNYHEDIVSFFNNNNSGAKSFYMMVFKSDRKFTSTTVAANEWNAMGWQLLCSSINSADLSEADTYAVYEFEENISIEAGCSIMIGFSTSRTSTPSLSWWSGNYVPIKLAFDNVSWNSEENLRSCYFYFAMNPPYKNDYFPRVYFHERSISEIPNHTHDEYLKKEDYFVQEKVICNELPSALKAGVVYDFGDCSYVYSAGGYDFSSLRFDEKYDGKVAQCEIVMSIPSSGANSQVTVPSGWVNENGSTPIELTASNTGKKLWFIVKYYGTSENVQNVVLKQFANF